MAKGNSPVSGRGGVATHPNHTPADRSPLNDREYLMNDIKCVVNSEACVCGACVSFTGLDLSGANDTVIGHCGVSDRKDVPENAAACDEWLLDCDLCPVAGSDLFDSPFECEECMVGREVECAPLNGEVVG